LIRIIRNKTQAHKTSTEWKGIKKIYEEFLEITHDNTLEQTWENAKFDLASKAFDEYTYKNQ
jgi:hypothetical protein